MSDPVTVSAIVMASISLAGSIFTPLVVGVVSFMNRITVSKCCCGGEIDLTKPPSPTSALVSNGTK